MKRVLLSFILMALFWGAASASENKRTSVSWQLGPESSSYNIDMGISRVSTLGLHYQMQFNEQKATNTNFLVKGLSNYGLNYEHFISKESARFTSGIVLTVGLHYTKLEESSLHQEVIFEEKEKIKSGESRTGGRIAASYRWYSRTLFAGAGIEANKTGKAISFLPLKIQLGLVF